MFGFAVDLGDGRVEIDHQLLTLDRAGSDCPCVGQQATVHSVELADMTERERPQECADRRRCQRHEPQHLPSRPRPQPVQRINVGCTGDHAHHDRHHLRRSIRDTGVNPPGSQTRKPEAARQGGHQQQARIGHQIRLVEDHLDPVRIVQRCTHRKCHFGLMMMRLRTPSFFQP